MSNNAQRFSNSSSKSNAAAQAAWGEFDPKNLHACQKQAWRTLSVERRPNHLGRRYFSNEAFAALMGSAIAEFEEVVGKEVFPYNYLPHPQGGNWLRDADFNQVMERCARKAGWVRAAAKLPGVRKVLEKGLSPNGVNSPHTKIYLEGIIEKFPSPHAFNKKVWAVKRRAEAILSAYQGDYHPAWADIANALMKRQSVGKAAIIVVAWTLERYTHAETYQEARDWLTTIRSARFPVADASDGVVCQREADPSYEKRGFAVYRIRLEHDYGRISLNWLIVAPDGRTYHAEQHFGWASPQNALKAAIRAWRKQAEVAREYRERHADVVPYLEGDELGFCPLFAREDSFAAGNCSIGTESFLKGLNWAGRESIPGVWLIPHLGRNDVLRVVQKNRLSHLPR